MLTHNVGIVTHPASEPRGGPVPSRAGAALISRTLLQGVGTRWPHVRAAARVAHSLAPLFDEMDARLLVAAATLHDIGYSPLLVRTGFHPADGAQFLRNRGFSERLVHLVAHHSYAAMTAPSRGVDDLDERFPGDEAALADALVYSDMHAGLDGRVIPLADRLSDIKRRHGASDFSLRSKLLLASVQRIESAMARARSGQSAAIA